jgi:hypothetical protein
MAELILTPGQEAGHSFMESLIPPMGVEFTRMASLVCVNADVGLVQLKDLRVSSAAAVLAQEIDRSGEDTMTVTLKRLKNMEGLLIGDYEVTVRRIKGA